MDASKTEARGWSRWIISALALGVVLRVAQYASNQSYWQDEASLLLNAKRLSIWKIAFSRLDATINTQAGPPVFLWWVKAAAALGGGELTTRFLPFALSIAMLVLVAVVARRMLGGCAAAVAVAIVALSDHLIFESATLKPYSGDLFMAAVLLWIARVGEDPTVIGRRFVLVSIVAAIGMWASYPLIFVFTAISLAALWPMMRARRHVAWLLCNAFVAASFSIVYWFCVRAQRNAYLDKYWEDRFADLAHPAKAVVHLVWLTVEIFRFALPPWGIVFFPLAIVGAIAWWRRGRRELVIAFVGPIVLVAVASVAHAYPYGGTRVTLFWAASVAILSAAGVEALAAMMKSPGWQCLVCALAVAPLVAATFIAIPCVIHPRCYGDMRAVTAHLRESSGQRDLICVIGNGMPALDWYWPDHGKNVVRGVDPRRIDNAGRFWIADSYDPRQGPKSLEARRREKGFTLDESQSLRTRGGDALLFIATRDATTAP